MASEKRLIDANAFNRGLWAREFDFFTKKQIKEWKKTTTADVGYSVVTIADVLDMTPTVDAVEVVHGRWVLVEYQSSPFGVDQEYQCSICGIPADYENITRYCPNCGARMDGEQDGK